MVKPVSDNALTLVSWNLTRRCNLACGHCYLDAVQRKSEARDELTTDEALAVIAQIGAAAPGAMLVLTGGEPLLRDDLEAIVAAAASQTLLPVIGTNGVLLNAARARSLRAAGAVGVGISVDSASARFHDRLRGHDGAWSGALAGAQAAREAGLALQLQATVFEENRRELALLAELAETRGAIALHFFFLVCTGRGVTQSDLSPDAYEETLRDILRLQEERRDKLMLRARCAPYMRRLMERETTGEGGDYAQASSACLAGRSYCRITPKGKLTPCPYMSEVVADLRQVSLSEAWATNDTLTRLRNDLPGGKCGDCNYRYSCGGCRARAAAASGDVLGEDPKCSYRRPTDASPETPPVKSGALPALHWEPEARALLERVPGFVRERVRERLEVRAAEIGISEITVVFMRSQWERSPLAARLKRP